MPRLAVTRTSAQLSDLAAHAAARGIELVPLPLISVNALPFDWPESFPIDQVDWIFFTSANGVTTFLHRLDQLGLHLPPSAKIAAVGTKTADVLRMNGITVHFIPSDAYGQLLFEDVGCLRGFRLRCRRLCLWCCFRRLAFGVERHSVFPFSHDEQTARSSVTTGGRPSEKTGI